MTERAVAQSRRRILTGAVAATGAWLLGQAARPLASRAATNDPALIGVLNGGTSTTAFQDTDAPERSPSWSRPAST
ncbi:MAG TPA: hypothetical protein VGI98_04305 [Candidatus Limnocylindrales bacterium]|jgi:hypothetical protein